jgi:hypothetical protein
MGKDDYYKINFIQEELDFINRLLNTKEARDTLKFSGVAIAMRYKNARHMERTKNVICRLGKGWRA